MVEENHHLLVGTGVNTLEGERKEGLDEIQGPLCPREN